MFTTVLRLIVLASIPFFATCACVAPNQPYELVVGLHLDVAPSQPNPTSEISNVDRVNTKAAFYPKVTEAGGSAPAPRCCRGSHPSASPAPPASSG